MSLSSIIEITRQVAEPPARYLSVHLIDSATNDSWKMSGPSWSEGVSVAGAEVTLQTKVNTPTPAVTYTERMSDAARELRRRINEKFGSRVFQTRSFRPRFEQDGDEKLDFLIVQAEISNANEEECADATDELIDFIVSHPDHDIQRDLSIEIFGRNA